MIINAHPGGGRALSRLAAALLRSKGVCDLLPPLINARLHLETALTTQYTLLTVVMFTRAS